MMWEHSEKLKGVNTYVRILALCHLFPYSIISSHFLVVIWLLLLLLTYSYFSQPPVLGALHIFPLNEAQPVHPQHYISLETLMKSTACATQNKFLFNLSTCL